MSYSSERIMLASDREGRAAQFPTWALFAVPLLSILFQIYVPLFFNFMAYLEVPLFVTIYFAMMRRAQVSGLLIGAVIGILQDSLSKSPLGMYGICMTLVGYFAASIALKIDVENPAIRLFLTFLFFNFHQFIFFVLSRALLGKQVLFEVKRNLLLGVINAVVAVTLFHFFDKLRERS